MKLSALPIFATAIGLASAAPTNIEDRSNRVQGFDISSYQPNVNFNAARADGARFVIIKVCFLADLLGVEIALY